jgi:hypothetical protein
LRLLVEAICPARQVETPAIRCGRDGARPAKWISAISILFIHVS